MSSRRRDPPTEAVGHLSTLEDVSRSNCGASGGTRANHQRAWSRPSGHSNTVQGILHFAIMCVGMIQTQWRELLLDLLNDKCIFDQWYPTKSNSKPPA